MMNRKSLAAAALCATPWLNASAANSSYTGFTEIGALTLRGVKAVHISGANYHAQAAP
jgi:hypothetical protein